MADTESRSLQAKEKAEVTAPGEDIRPGLVFTPAVDILENEKELKLFADMPGVNAKNLTIDLNENVLTLSGDVEAPDRSDEVDLLREYRTGRYFREFRLSQVIDQRKIEAELKDGVLSLILPKVEKAKPRKIEVRG
ncbi:MAG: Hsp20/alpha crystallin family protein [Desulfobacteraceae bacterium]|nr:MAG: Hsp20/alpha crystallin family protein [Desulfobacteraceae bacterium]